MQQLKPGFYVFNSNDLDNLALAACYLMEHYPPPNALEREKVVVMNLGMETYFTQFLANYSGVASQCEYLQIWQLIFQVHRLIHPGADRRNLFSRMYMTLNILGLRDEWGRAPPRGAPDYFQKMRDYLERDAAHDKAYMLAARLADTLDQYQMYRPQWIEQWNKWTEEDFAFYYQDPTADGVISRFIKAESRDKPSSVRGILQGNIWQMHIWSRLRHNLAPTAGHNMQVTDGSIRADHVVTAEEDPLLYLDRAGVVSRLTAQLASGEGNFAHLPSRIFIFGVSALPPQVIRFLQALAQRCAVCLMLLNPCAQYWGDLTADSSDFFSKFKKARRQSQLLPDVPRQHTPAAAGSLDYLQAEHYDGHSGELLEGNALLLGLGRQGMDNLSLLCALDPMPQFTDLFLEHEPDCLLHSLQQQLLQLQQPGGEKVEILPDDRSLEIHICHTRLREMEVLRDALLRRFKEAAEAGRPLQPREIVVMVPTINDYAPYISAVFGAVPENDPNYLPYAISDRTQLEDSPLCEAVLSLLNISARRISNVLVADLLSIEPLARHFGISPDDVAVIEEWFAEAAVFWGLDDEDTREESKIPLPGTFERGLQRMLAGTMGGEQPGCGAYSEIEGDDAQLLGNLYDFIAKLRRLRAYFTPHLQLQPEEWRRRLELHIFNDFFDDDEEVFQQKQIIMQIVDEMRDCCLDLKEPPLITLPVFHALLQGHLSNQRNYSPFLRGRINFCSLVPMRAVPFRHIFILGLNDGEFPRHERMPGFNLLGVSDLYRRGDRSRSLDDRFLFLDALISARESIYFSYIGESPVSQQELSPSVVLTELLDYLADNFKVGSTGSGELEEIKRRLCCREHLNAYNPENFTVRGGEGALPLIPSFEGSCCIAEQEKAGDRQVLGLCSDWGLEYPQPVQLDLGELQDFLYSPPRFFLRHCLKINLQRDDDTLQECEDFERGDADNAGVCQEILNHPAAESEQILHGENLSGRQPFGIFGQHNCQKIAGRTTLMRQILQEQTGLENLSQRRSEHISGVEWDIEIPEELSRPDLDGHCRFILSADFLSCQGGSCSLVQPYLYYPLKFDSKTNPNPWFKALLQQLSYFLHYQQGAPCLVFDSVGRAAPQQALSAAQCREALQELLTLYLIGRSRPLPVCKAFLQGRAALKKDGDPLSILQPPATYQERDPAFIYLFGSPGTVADNQELTALALRFADFYKKFVYDQIGEVLS